MRIIYNSKGLRPQWELIFSEKAAEVPEICYNFPLDAVLSAPFNIILG